ncbi:MAG: SRPBCC family protein [Actinomycetota bacterium]
MDIHASLDAPCSADALFAFVDDLTQYSRWSTLVHRADVDPAVSTAWQVELRARVGPLARSKRLRMARTVRDPNSHVAVFERSEIDGKRHAPWVLRAEVNEVDGISTLQMHLHYGGGLWTAGVLERVLADQITNGRERLLELVSTTH